MKKIIFKLVPIVILSVFVFRAEAQVNADTKPVPKIYRQTVSKVNSLVHTKLEVRFDYSKQFMYGKAWLTLKPYAYSTDSLKLDAKGMDINNVSIVKSSKIIPLKYSYDSLELRIILDKNYKADEQYMIFIDYTSKPNQLKAKGSAAISDAKGLYFINPDSAVKNKPVQIWTQGETEASSVWFPTIDKPNQKTTSEISMTVPSKYVTLSNGRLVSQKSNTNSTRTDTWKMDLPHAPYLFMMAVGDFKIYKDKWRDKEVSYYLEPEYAPYAKQIFGMTPKMMEFFSKKLGVDYPWNKYSQIVVRDYISGAMENTTATIHGDFVQQTPGELIDESAGEFVIAHELFHQWFGDYVTAESWSNLTVNESFANFSQVLWNEYKHGKDAGDYGNFIDMQDYLRSPEDVKKDLVRFNYKDKEDMFDLVSYQKGGRILNMLRNYLGEEVFYKGLNIYLKQNAFKTGEAHQVRLALEEASGKDLNWFFDQWYFRSGHPVLKIDYKWDETTKKQSVYLQQTQEGEAFTLPVAIDFYAGGKMERHEVWMDSKADTFIYSFAVKPDLVNVDAHKILLAQKTDSKTLNEYVFQYFNAPLFVDRQEAITEASKKQDDAAARKVMIAALNDKFFRLRIKAINSLDLKNPEILKEAAPILSKLASSDPSTLVQSAAIRSLARSNDSSNLTVFSQAFKSKSYSVQAAAMSGVAALDNAEGLRLAKTMEKDSKGAIRQSVINIYSKYGGPQEAAFVVNEFDNASVNGKFQMIENFFVLLGNMNETAAFNTNFNKITSLIEEYKQYGIGKQLIPLLTMLKDEKLAKAKSSKELSAQLNTQADSVKKVIENIQAGK
ncbi:M1 family metallopeptidase [Daejeonella oryzae]|uniref:M1 family metallopeptidase n=1 Tax=Daejeonella oryzae TaxID=1122943 RepID=UPI0004142B27|nr:M1 family metallopeptidase [Daejeonella oryzae]